MSRPYVLCWPARPEDRAVVEAIAGELPDTPEATQAPCSLCRRPLLVGPRVRAFLTSAASVPLVCPLCILREVSHSTPGL